MSKNTAREIRRMVEDGDGLVGGDPLSSCRGVFLCVIVIKKLHFLFLFPGSCSVPVLKYLDGRRNVYKKGLTQIDRYVGLST